MKNYGVLKGRVFDRKPASAQAEHYQLLVNRSSNSQRVAINTLSQTAPALVLFYHDDNFHHAITDAILAANLPNGYTELRGKSDANVNVKGICLDQIRSNLFHLQDMKPLQPSAPGPDNDLNDKLDMIVKQAINDPSAVLYAFGEHWQDTTGADNYFPELSPSRGIHQIHMNQGNPAGSSYYTENGIYQDGGLLFHFPSQGKWVAVFTAFQSQMFHTDDVYGKPLPGFKPGLPPAGAATASLHIVAAMVNPSGNDTGKEFVLLLNTGTTDINLSGWQIADNLNKRDTIGNITLHAGDTVKVTLSGNGAQMPNSGGTITLLNKDGIKVSGVSYTKADAATEGVLVRF